MEEKKYTLDEVKQLIEKYFSRKPEPITDKDGNNIAVTANTIEYDMKPPTLTGLIRNTIGRSRWEAYKKDPEYKEVLEDAEDRVEEFHEAQLSRGSAQGSIFYLKNKGRGWREDLTLSPQPAVVVAMSLDKSDEELYKKNLEVFFNARSETDTDNK